MEKFVELRPNEAAAHIAMGDVHRACMHLDQAIIDYSKAISLDPASDVAYSKRGYINAYQGAFDDACKDWEMSLNLAKSNSKISWPNYSMLSYLHERNGELPIDKTSCNLVRSNNLKNSKHQLEGSENDHYFCCTVISMKHGLYVSPYQNLNECHALQREFTQESKAPDQLTINADITFIKCINAIQDGNFELASKMAQEHARLAEPSLNPRRLQVYNYMMGLINLKQQHYNIAVSNFLNSDLNNSCIKFALGLAYDGLGEWDKAQAMFREVSANNFTSGSKPWVAKISNNWLNAYTTKLNGE
jgi:tetratricopeptide (TPR) repeat protein